MRNLFFILLGSLSIITIFMKVRKKLFSEEKSLFWMFGGIILLILSICPILLDKTASFLGIAYGPSLLFLLSTLFVIYIIFRQEQDISLLNERMRELAQRNALLEARIRLQERDIKQ